MSQPTIPDGNQIPLTPLYDPSGHQVVAERAYNVSTDATTGIVYGDPATGAGGGGGGAITAAAGSYSAGALVDGADVTQGLTTDAAVTGDTSGTLSAKLRGLSKILADIWDSVNHRIKVDGSGVTQPVSGTVTANIQHGNAVDAGNSSTATLTANSVYNGTSTSALNYSAIAIEAYSDQASAANGLQVLQSQDGTNFDLTDSFTVSAATAFTTVVNLVGQYYKVKYTNGGTNQATFRLQTIKQAAESVLPRTLSANGNLKVAIQEDNTTGLATSANQSTANTSLSSIVTNTNKLIAPSVNAGNRDATTQRVRQAGNGTATVTQVASSATSGQLLAANTNKEGTLFFNDSTAILYLLYGSGTASPTNYSVQIGAKQYFEDPLHFTGVFTGIWASANGNLYATEIS